MIAKKVAVQASMRLITLMNIRVGKSKAPAQIVETTNLASVLIQLSKRD